MRFETYFRPSGTKKLIESMSSNSNKIHILLMHTRNILKDVYLVVGGGLCMCGDRGYMGTPFPLLLEI